MHDGNGEPRCELEAQLVQAQTVIQMTGTIPQITKALQTLAQKDDTISRSVKSRPVSSRSWEATAARVSGYPAFGM